MARSTSALDIFAALVAKAAADLTETAAKVEELARRYQDYKKTTPSFIDEFLSPEGIITKKRAIDREIGECDAGVAERRGRIGALQKDNRALGEKVDEYRKTLEDQRGNRIRMQTQAAGAEEALGMLRREIAGQEGFLKELEKEKEAAEKYIEMSKRMKDLINDLLAYSRVGTHVKSLEPVDCEAVLAEVLSNLEASIRETSGTVTHDPLPTLTADRFQMVQLFQNLISNGLKFHKDKPPAVHLGVVEEGDDWKFSVRDNGIGIDPQSTERIFAIFQRLHTREEYPGTGIGLAVCRRIVERHGGRIWVESAPGKGSTFLLTISKVLKTQ